MLSQLCIKIIWYTVTLSLMYYKIHHSSKISKVFKVKLSISMFTSLHEINSDWIIKLKSSDENTNQKLSINIKYINKYKIYIVDTINGTYDKLYYIRHILYITFFYTMGQNVHHSYYKFISIELLKQIFVPLFEKSWQTDIIKIYSNS